MAGVKKVGKKIGKKNGKKNGRKNGKKTLKQLGIVLSGKEEGVTTGYIKCSGMKSHKMK